MKVALALLVASLGMAVVHAEDRPAPSAVIDGPPRCANTSSCEFLWAAARNWVVAHCQMKIRTVADGYLETESSPPSDPRLQCRVTKDPHPEGGYSLAVVAGCGSGAKCAMDTAEAVRSFNQDVQRAAPFRDWTTQFLDRLRSPDSDVRRNASEELRGSGFKSAAVFGAIAEIVERESSGTPGREQVGEIKQHLETLASTGASDYLPVLQRAASSSNRSISRSAKSAIEEMKEAGGKPIIDSEKVMLILETKATGCTFVKQFTCEMDECAEMTAEAGANAVVVGHGESSYFLTKSTLVGRAFDCGSP